MNSEINLRKFFSRILKRWYVLVLVSGVFVSLVYIKQTFFEEKTYRSSTELLILPQKNSEETTNDANIRLNIQLMNTYMSVMKSTTVLEAVRKNTKIEDSAGRLRKNLLLSSDTNSLTVNLKMTANSPYKSQELANTIATTTKDYLADLFPDNQLIILNPAGQGTRVQSKSAYLIALFMGIWGGILVVTIELFSQNVVRDSENLSSFGFPTIGIIPEDEHTQDKNGRKRQVWWHL
ncbi:hypothetical protein H3T55_14315 [Enterococcus sp. S22(2020)]|nr:hypothetical protein [Enterococcus sp. S23]MCA5017439.1 hypothetical protein [Enterococcus sp. S22(2020)]